MVQAIPQGLIIYPPQGRCEMHACEHPFQKNSSQKNEIVCLDGVIGRLTGYMQNSDVSSLFCLHRVEKIGSRPDDGLI